MNGLLGNEMRVVYGRLNEWVNQSLDRCKKSKCNRDGLVYVNAMRVLEVGFNAIYRAQSIMKFPDLAS